ncbi:MAG: DsbA family oxidoreductase, partial [Acidobacteriota bacterium]
NPEAPATSSEPVDYAQRLASKYGMGRPEAQGFIDRMTQAGRDAGVEMRFDRIRPCNTFNAHRLLAWARTLDRQDALKERLFTAYLKEGRDLNDAATLRELASDVGLDADAASAVLDGGDFAQHVRADQALAQRLGITGVPFFVFGHGLAASGAQPPATLLEALSKAHALETRESPATAADS